MSLEAPQGDRNGKHNLRGHKIALKGVEIKSVWYTKLN